MGRLYEVTRVKGNNATGRRLAIVEARNRRHAGETVMKMKDVDHVRVFPVKLHKKRGSTVKILTLR